MVVVPESVWTTLAPIARMATVVPETMRVTPMVVAGVVSQRGEETPTGFAAR